MLRLSYGFAEKGGTLRKGHLLFGHPEDEEAIRIDDRGFPWRHRITVRTRDQRFWYGMKRIA
jgi:hypothetical protein